MGKASFINLAFNITILTWFVNKLKLEQISKNPAVNKQVKTNPI